MDLALYVRVLWRFRLIVLTGTALAIVVALLSFVKVGFNNGAPSVSYREPETWKSTGTVFVTQAGFPLGRSIFDEVVPVDGTDASTASYVPRYNEPLRYSGYSLLFARLSMSDRVLRLMREDGPIPGSVVAEPTRDEVNPSATAPLVEISGVASSPNAARSVARRATEALVTFLRQEQEKNGIPVEKRVVLQVLDDPDAASKLAGRSVTRPAFFFIAAMMAVLALVFILENLRPRIRQLPSHENRSETTRRVA